MSDLLKRTGEALYGPQWQSQIARDLDISDRHVRRMTVDGQPLKAGIAHDLRKLALERITEIEAIANELNDASRSAGKPGRIFGTISKIEIASLTPELREELDDVDFEAFEAGEMEHGFATGNALQIAWHAQAHRAGIVYVGSGSSGATSWTDARSPEDALQRYLNDDMIN